MKSLCAAFLLFISAGVTAQTGLPAYSSIQSSGFDNINRYNLNVEFEVPLTTVKSRGFDFVAKLVNNSLIWTKVGSPAVWIPVGDSDGWPTWGWNSFQQSTQGAYSWNGRQRCVANDGSNQWSYTYYGITGTDSGGTVHTYPSFSVTLAEDPDEYPECGDYPEGTVQNLSDGTGFTLQVTLMGGPGPANGLHVTLLSPKGYGVGSTGTSSDQNGNVISNTYIDAPETDYQDTTGRTDLKILNKLTLSSPRMEYQYADTSGTWQTVKFLVTNYNIKTNFACPGVSEYSLTNQSLPYQILLADGTTKYEIEYEDTPGSSGYKTGRISRIHLPTGGYVAYSYLPSGYTHDPVNCDDGTPLYMAQTLQNSSGTAIALPSYFNRSTSAGSWSTDETTPASNHSVFGFTYVGQVFSEADYQGAVSGSNLLRQSFGGGPTPATTSVIYGSQTATTAYTYDAYGQMASKMEYAWNTTSSPVRTTEWTYYDDVSDYLNAGLGGLVKAMQIKDDTGAVISKTAYFYDGKDASGAVDSTQSGWCTDISSSGAPSGHNTSYTCSGRTVRGDLTMVINYPVPSSTVGQIVTRYNYDNTGNLIAAVPNANVSSLSYPTIMSYADSWKGGPSPLCSPGSSWHAYASPSSWTTNGLITTASYYPCTGAVYQQKDPANTTELTTYDYTNGSIADPFNRVRKITAPDGGVTTNTFPSLLQAVSTPTGTATIPTTVNTDDLGRVVNIQYPGADQAVKVDYGQNVSGGMVLASASNPHFPSTSSGTDGATITTHDPLGRVTQVLAADGNSTSTLSYANFGTTGCVTATDPKGHGRILCYDALGRLASVTEDPGTLNYFTAYQYDVLDNVTAICQGAAFGTGGSCTGSSVRARTFTYDGLSRLLTETTPEVAHGSGYIEYRYQNTTGLSGVPCSAVSSQLCFKIDADGVMTTYSYDQYARLTGKSYTIPSTGSVTVATPSVSYTYDDATCYIGSFSYSIPHGVGRRTGMTDGSGGSGHTCWGYDPMGRTTVIRRKIGSATSYATYSYNPYGLLTLAVDFAGKGFYYSYTYDNQEQNNYVGGVLDDYYIENSTFDPLGHLTSALNALPTGGGGDTTRYQTFNSLGQMTAQSAVQDSGPTLYNLTYDYYGTGSAVTNGNLMSVTDHLHTGDRDSQRFSYDNVNRIATASGGPSSTPTWTQSFSIDPFGNLNAVTYGGTGAGYSWNSTGPSLYNQISNVTYDTPTGRMSNDGANNYAYDAEGRIVAIGTSKSFTYDGDGSRVSATDASGTTLYWPGADGHIIDESDAAGTAFGEHFWFAGMLMWEKPYSASSPGHLLFQDALGSTRVTTLADGTPVGDYSYYPYGQVIDHGTISGTKSAFTGYETEGTLDDYAQYRNLHTEFGRFNRPDPYLGSYDRSNPQSLNRYTYARNNPMALVDPNGLNVSVCVTDGDCYTYTDDEWNRMMQGGYGGGVTDDGQGNLICNNVVCGTVWWSPNPDSGGWTFAPPHSGYDDIAPSITADNPVHGSWIFGFGPFVYGNYCGAGGQGPVVSLTDAGCRGHDVCFGAANTDFTSMTSEGAWNKLLPAQQSRVQACNQQLCESERDVRNEIPSWNVKQTLANDEIILFFSYGVPKGARCTVR